MWDENTMHHMDPNKEEEEEGSSIAHGAAAQQELQLDAHRPLPSTTLRPYLQEWGLWVVASRPMAVATFIPTPEIKTRR